MSDSTQTDVPEVPEEIRESLNLLLDMAWRRGMSDAASAFTQWGHKDLDLYYKWLMLQSEGGEPQ